MHLGPWWRDVYKVYHVTLVVSENTLRYISNLNCMKFSYAVTLLRHFKVQRYSSVEIRWNIMNG